MEWWAVIENLAGRVFAGYAIDVYPEEKDVYRKSFRRRKAKVVEGFMAAEQAHAEVHRQLLMLCERMSGRAAQPPLAGPAASEP